MRENLNLFPEERTATHLDYTILESEEKIDLQTQLDAITALGCSSTKKALVFLTRLYTPHSVNSHQVFSQFGSWNPTTSGFNYRELHYPNAKGKLKKDLNLKVSTGSFNSLNIFSQSEKDIQEKLQHQKNASPAHMSLNYAIQRLKKDLDLDSEALS